MRKIRISDQAARRMKGAAAAKKETRRTVPGDASCEQGVQEERFSGLRVISRTDTGLIRKNNQDALILGEGLMGVADGMGGHNGGETASAGASEGLRRELRDAERSAGNLEKAVRTINRELWDMQNCDESLSGMGTTLTVLWAAGSNMLIAHVGDSRAYLLRDGEFRTVTEDHSMVAEMVRRGMLTEEQAACHPMRNYITRAVGTEEDIDVDILTFPRKRGDRWLICSDGLHGPVSREELKRLAGADDPDEAADQMVRLALEAGGRDNISLVLVIDDGGQPEETEAAE